MKAMKLLALVCLSVAAPSLFGQQQGSPAPDQIFYNGKIITVDSGNSIQQAFAIRGDHFVAVGSNSQIRAMAGPQTRLVDLNGRAVIPGLMDDHTHPWRYTFQNLRGIALTGVKSVAEMTDRIRKAATTSKPGRTIYATGRWNEADLAEKRGPSRSELDQLMPDRPLMVLGPQKAFLNTAALKAAQLTRDTKWVYGDLASLPKDSSGEPTGEIVGAFPIMVVGARLIPIEDIRELWLKTQHDLNGLGFTSIREPMVPNEIMRMYSDLRRERKLTLRISMGLDVGSGQADELDEILKPLGVGPSFGDHWLRLDSIGEYAVDGSGLINSTPDKFRRGILTMNRYGWRPAPHIGGGDEYVDQALVAYEAANAERSIRDQRWVLEHIPIVRQDQLDRMARLGVVVAANFQAYRGAENMIKTYGQERAERAVPIRDMLDRHLIVAAGSDWPGATDNPFVPFYFYVTRKTENGTVLGPGQKISREEALRVSTINNAYLTFEEDIKGSIEPDKVADFLILSQDILTVPEEQIRSLYPLETYVGGQKVFSK